MTKGSLLFVHGTGVRSEGYERLLQAVAEGLHGQGIEATLPRCAWGDDLGVSTDKVEDTLPEELVTKDALGEPVVKDAQLVAAAWSLLAEDPLFELRLLGEGKGPADGGIAVGEDPPDLAAELMLRQLQSSPPELAGTEIELEEFASAVNRLIKQPELGTAANAVGSASDPEFVEALARAVLALVLAEHRVDPPGTLPAVAANAEVRDGLVESILGVLEVAVLKEYRAVRWTKRKIGNFAARRVTNWALDRRDSLLSMSGPFVGDILFYQRRGHEIRSYVLERLTGLERPVVAVGHSLGGIVLIDRLSREDPPAVEQRVTVGSQSPLFFIFDALERLRPQDPLAAPFTPWLNIYNPQDFLSFCAHAVFGDTTAILDKKVDPGVPFPASHSAYWHDEQVYQLIRENWPPRP